MQFVCQDSQFRFKHLRYAHFFTQVLKSISTMAHSRFASIDKIGNVNGP